MIARGVSARTRANAGAGGRSPEPAYLMIANTIADRIGSGVYHAGDQLPTEAQLRAEFGVSPMTVRRAINILLDRGVVTTTQGKGTFVRNLDLGEAVFRLQQITDLWLDDDSVRVPLLSAGIVPADALVASKLQCPEGTPTVFLRRLIERKGIPLMYQLENLIYDEYRPLVEAQLQITSLDGLLRSASGEGMQSGQLTIEAVNLEDDAAKFLGVVPNSAAFCLEHLFRDFHGQVVSWGRYFCRADRFRLTTVIGIARPDGVTGATSAGGD
ncbi:MAG: GntR family transcriptional regulator [Actinobacteria bacterium]|nr:GntR family transcriptional regulator [Actinomycetota bacterium]